MTHNFPPKNDSFHFRIFPIFFGEFLPFFFDSKMADVRRAHFWAGKYYQTRLYFHLNSDEFNSSLNGSSRFELRKKFRISRDNFIKFRRKLNLNLNLKKLNENENFLEKFGRKFVRVSLGHGLFRGEN